MKVINTTGMPQEIVITHIEDGTEQTLQLQPGPQEIPDGWGISAARRPYYQHILHGIREQDDRIVSLDRFALNGERDGDVPSPDESTSEDVKEPEAATTATTDDEDETVEDDDADSTE